MRDLRILLEEVRDALSSGRMHAARIQGVRKLTRNRTVLVSTIIVGLAAALVGLFALRAKHNPGNAKTVPVTTYPGRRLRPHYLRTAGKWHLRGMAETKAARTFTSNWSTPAHPYSLRPTLRSALSRGPRCTFYCLRWKSQFEWFGAIPDSIAGWTVSEVGTS